MCKNVIAQLWGLTLGIGIFLLFICMILSNSPPGSKFYNLMVDLGISGGVIVMLCFSAACCFQKLKLRILYDTYEINSSQNRQILVHEPIQIAPALAVATYIQNTIPNELYLTDDIVIAEPINQV